LVTVPVAGFLSAASGWAIHKPMQLHWLASLFGGYDSARVWHFWLMWLFIHLRLLVGFRNRVFVFFQWCWAYLTAQRRARIIVGPGSWRGPQAAQQAQQPPGQGQERQP